MSALPVARLAFQPMQVSDLDAVSAAEQCIYPFPWTRGNFADSLKAGHRGWLCLEDGAMVGYAIIMVVLEEVHLLNISVLPERQRQGIGSALLQHLFAEGRAGRAQRMFLEVRVSNASGLALYRHFGFAVVGQRRGYYPAAEGREDAIVMARDLP
jgi:ribosomal-protein-alanine N-acetyltransferase